VVRRPSRASRGVLVNFPPRIEMGRERSKTNFQKIGDVCIYSGVVSVFLRNGAFFVQENQRFASVNWYVCIDLGSQGFSLCISI